MPRVAEGKEATGGLLPPEINVRPDSTASSAVFSLPAALVYSPGRIAMGAFWTGLTMTRIAVLPEDQLAEFRACLKQPGDAPSDRVVPRVRHLAHRRLPLIKGQ